MFFMYEIDNQKFGRFVAALRKEKGYTQKELAEKLFLSDKAISKWERGLEFYDLRGKDYDDPQWDKLLDQITVDEMVELIGWGRFQTVTINSIGKLATLDTDGPAGVNSFMTGSFGTGYCAGILVAQTWNEDLAYKLAQGISQELQDFGLNAGTDVHEPSQKCFRRKKFEYYSEDSILSARMEEAEVNAALDSNIYPYLKHFAFNEQGQTGMQSAVHD